MLYAIKPGCFRPRLDGTSNSKDFPFHLVYETTINQMERNPLLMNYRTPLVNTKQGRNQLEKQAAAPEPKSKQALLRNTIFRSKSPTFGA